MRKNKFTFLKNSAVYWKKNKMKTVQLSTKYSASTHYDTLRIEDSASAAEIKNAYIQRCKEFHPDLNDCPEAAEKFRKVRDAYRVLSNANTKMSYDYEIGNLMNNN